MTQRDETESIDAFLRSLGASGEQITVAHREGHLSRLAGDLVIAEGATLSATDLASRAGVDVPTVLRVWRTLGVHVPDEHQPMFSERDAALTAHLFQLNPVGPNGDELLRVLGSSLARVAEAAVSLYVQTVQPRMDLPETDVVAWANDLATATPPPSSSETRWEPSSPITCATPSIGSVRPNRKPPTDRCTGWPSASLIWSASPLSPCTLPLGAARAHHQVRGQGIRGGGGPRRSHREAHRRRGHVRRPGRPSRVRQRP